MKTAISVLVLITVYPVVTYAYGLSDYEDVTRLRLVGEPDYKTVEEVNARWADGRPFAMETVYESSRDTGKYYLIICNGDLFSEISSSLLGDYVSALEYEGFAVTVTATADVDMRASDVALRNQLVDFYEENGYFHALLVGDLPVPFYEMDVWDYEYFPIDLFYMDLDGEWVDEDDDGVWDEHYYGDGDWFADIPVGRWTASPLIYDGHTEVGLIENYIAKNLAYRAGDNPCQERALCYVDDDWSYWGHDWTVTMMYAYDDVTGVYDPYATYAEDYEDRLDDDYEFIQVCAHSNWLLHQFQLGETYDNTHFYEVYDIKPKALFYNLFACSNARYTETNYMAGWYAFMDDDCGLAAIGSTKTGSMLNFEDFYGPLGSNLSIGEAFRYWMECWADAGGDSRPWHYGMALIGDPTLYISQFVDIEIAAFDAIQKGEVVAVRWEYAADEDFIGFNLYRTEKVDIKGVGVTPASVKLNDELIVGRSPLVYADDAVAPGVTYEYTLEAVRNGPAVAEAMTEITVEPSEKGSFYLAAPYPNPALADVCFEYSVPENLQAELVVYDLKGRSVRVLETEPEAGSAVWNLHDAAGRRVAPGVYVARLSAGGENAVKKVVVLE
ncbi:MAG: T9SS type A sorting domain-containing protein [Candidatus Coatesbacteria bacterium]|nr:MAG: T9SS type A sorting domain-containing protein [Candidatus Coatesbacteria bacterium]